MRTVDARVRTKRTTAESRKPSPFGLTVANSALSPANGAEPFDTRTSTSSGAGRDAAAIAATSGTITERSVERRTAVPPLTVSLLPAQAGHTDGVDTEAAMRRLLVIFGVLALAAPAASVAGKRDPSDGTLSVRNGRGTFSINGKGVIIGSFVHGKVVITDPIDGDGTGPIVSGDDWHKDRDDKTTVSGGTKVRFRLVGGTFRIRVVGTGVNLSVVGNGRG